MPERRDGGGRGIARRVCARRSLQQRTVVIEVGSVEIRQLHQSFEIMDLDLPMPKSDKASLTQFTKDPVHVNGTQP